MQLDPGTGHFALQPYRGGLALVGAAINRAIAHFSQEQPTHPLHITLLTAAEYKMLGHPPCDEVKRAVRTDHIYLVGTDETRDGRVKWVVALWNHANVWRERHGLEPKDYHVSLTDANDHSARKDLSLSFWTKHADPMAAISSLGESGLDHAAVACRDFHLVSTRLVQLLSIQRGLLAERLIELYPESPRGYLRLADACEEPRIVACALAQAAVRAPELIPRVRSRLRRLRDTTTWGPVLTSSEPTRISLVIRPVLQARWPPELNLPELWTAPVDKRQHATFLGEELPRFFSWLYPDRLAGMSTPRDARDIDMLCAMGISHVLSLTQETPLDERWFAFKAEHVFVPVANYAAPTLAEMDVIYERVLAGGAWLVHCGGGVGRAGAVLACLIAMFGEDGGGGAAPGTSDDVRMPRLDAKTAIRLLRRARPTSIESEEQERFVATWVSHRWKAHHRAAPAEPSTRLLESGERIAPHAVAENTLLVMVGKPASGKSWVASAIVKRRPRGTTVVINQDESGSRAACERQLSRATDPRVLVILDRCNPTARERAAWLALTSRKPIAVFFDYPRDLCQARLDKRIGHPTLRAGLGTNALDQFDKLMEPPTLAETLAAVVTVTSFAAAREAVWRLTGAPSLVKFPRTPHLLDLGATTPDDVVLPAFEVLRGNGSDIVVEEKMDGANVGISLDWDGALRVQNRSHWVSPADHAQFKPLGRWLAAHDAALRRVLDRDDQFPERHILYGEWMVAKHSIHYAALPGPFFAFDLYDRLEQTFASRQVLASALAGSDVPQVPLLSQCSDLTRQDALQLLQRQSTFSDSRIEGVYVRTQDAGALVTIGRGKIVRSDFIAGNEHWSRGPLILNGMQLRNM